jgi:hypothetical protein
MITFRSSVDKTEHRVLFAPRPGTSQGAKDVYRKLLYGYRCQFCRNPILFAFLTPNKISLKKYEETRVVNGVQEFHMVIPGEHSKHDTAYHIDFIPVAGQEMGLQRVRLRNHIIREDILGKKDAVAEEGQPRCCPYASLFGLRTDLLIKDTILMGGFPERELEEYNLPSWSVFQDLIKEDDRHFFTEGLGGLPLVNVRTDFIADQKGIAHWRGVLLPFKKPKVEEGEDLVVAGTGDEYHDSSTELIDYELCVSRGEHGLAVDDDGNCTICGEYGEDEHDDDGDDEDDE